MRPELAVLIPSVLILIALAAYKFRLSIFRSPAKLTLLCIPLFLPLTHIIFATMHYDVQRNMMKHYTLIESFLYWVRPGLYCPIWTLFALIGAFFLIKEGRGSLSAILLGGWLVNILLIAVYRKVDPNMGDLQRYFVLGGTAPLLLTGYFTGRLTKVNGALGAFVVGVILAFQIASLPEIKEPLSPVTEVRGMQENWLKEHLDYFPDDAIIFTERPPFVWAITGRKSFSLAHFITPAVFEKIDGLRKPMFVIKGSEVNVPAGGARMRSSNPMEDYSNDVHSKLNELGAKVLIEEEAPGGAIVIYRVGAE
jgi:hypothetical protein